jgi:LPXTG-site transpeptidase (sortase) family protein
MQGSHSWLETARYYTSLSLVYILTVAFGWLALHPIQRPPAPLAFQVQLEQLAAIKHLQLPTGISGKPIRIVIPDSGVDLPIDDGYYDEASGEWTLSGDRAQYAVSSSLANTQAGDTFIYGHNNNHVFGALRHNTPAVGAQALVYTDNNHIFSYRFATTKSLTPDDTSALHYQGKPQLTIQTCTGSFNEWRTLFQFSFDKVVQ